MYLQVLHIFSSLRKTMHRRDDEGLILPKKIIIPTLENKDVRDLHRELIFNQKMYVYLSSHLTSIFFFLSSSLT
jgi:hypothetical protein